MGIRLQGSIVDKLEELIKETGLGITDYDSIRKVGTEIKQRTRMMRTPLSF